MDEPGVEVGPRERAVEVSQLMLVSTLRTLNVVVYTWI